MASPMGMKGMGGPGPKIFAHLGQPNMCSSGGLEAWDSVQGLGFDLSLSLSLSVGSFFVRL